MTLAKYKLSLCREKTKRLKKSHQQCIQLYKKHVQLRTN